MAGIVLGGLGALSRFIVPSALTAVTRAVAPKVIPWIAKKVAGSVPDIFIPSMLKNAKNLIPQVALDRFGSISNKVLSNALASGVGALSTAGVDDAIKRLQNKSVPKGVDPSISIISQQFSQRPFGSGDALFGNVESELRTLQVLDMLNRNRFNYNPYSLMYHDTGREERRYASRVKGASELYRELDRVTKERNRIGEEESRRNQLTAVYGE